MSGSVKAKLRCIVLQVVPIGRLVGDLLFSGEFIVIHAPLFYLTTDVTLFSPRARVCGYGGRMSGLLIR
jgi:hypothetical protein